MGNAILEFHDRLAADLIRDEGLRLKPYVDTVGKVTIGVGRNLTDQGITEAEAHILLANDISDVMWQLAAKAPWYGEMTEARQLALLNMCFNMGWPRLSGFQKMLSALQAGDYETAANEALNSDWARQVKGRAQRIAEMIRNG